MVEKSMLYTQLGKRSEEVNKDLDTLVHICNSVVLSMVAIPARALSRREVVDVIGFSAAAALTSAAGAADTAGARLGDRTMLVLSVVRSPFWRVLACSFGRVLVNMHDSMWAEELDASHRL